MAFVEFRDVCKTYHMGDVEVRAVDGMSFTIERGELVVIVGPSGAGKTTVLNMLGGMDSCTSGTIELDDSLVSSMGERELTQYRRHDIGFVFQFYNLVQNLTALENVELASQICTDPLPAAEVLAQVGLADRMDNFPAQLSGGEHQRVVIALPPATHPKLLPCSAPTGAFDHRTAKQLLALLLVRHRGAGRTGATVTLNQAFTQIADRVIRVREGDASSVELNAHPADAASVEW